jgi:hypothetical protein
MPIADKFPKIRADNRAAELMNRRLFTHTICTKYIHNGTIMLPQTIKNFKVITSIAV